MTVVTPNSLDACGGNDLVRAHALGDSESIRQVRRLIKVAASNDVPVLMTGEIGTGKIDIARSIHDGSGRSDRAWQVVNCASDFPETIEVRLFGSDQSFLQSAHGGTLFLSEVEHLTLTAQLRLLDLIQRGQFASCCPSVDANHPTVGSIKTDVRVIAATHHDLRTLVAEGLFREDLFWKLNTLPIDVPPLRRRRDDIGTLTVHYLEQASDVHQKKLTRVSTEASSALVEYAFPGNLLELKTYMERAVVLAETNELTRSLLPPAITGGIPEAQSYVFRPTDDEALLREFVNSQLGKAGTETEDLFERIVGPLEKELIAQVLEACQQTQTKAAKRLGINRNTLYKKLVQFGLVKPKAETKE
ncbi:MAG: sigma 54-interacting transcriptional regulator [Planctomycetota bacterium]